MLKNNTMVFKIEKLTKDKYEEWNNFCLESSDAWFAHTADWLEYTLNYRPELKTQNLSFFVYWKEEIIAIVPLTLEVSKLGKGKYNEFSFGGGEIFCPALKNDLSEKEREKAYDFIFSEIDERALKNQVVRSRFRFSQLTPNFFNKKSSFNYLLKYGFIDISLNTLHIDLTKSEEELKLDLRRNHKRCINKGKDYQVKVYTSKNITKEIFNEYREMHHKAAGRQTRPDITFDLMYKWITMDWAFLVIVELPVSPNASQGGSADSQAGGEGKRIGVEYYSIYKNTALGFSAANDPDFEDLPIRHKLEWEAILWMKKQGFSIYEIGWQWYHNQLHDFPDKKLLSISHFKKGFGGFTVPLFRGEKYYDKIFFLEVYNERIKKFAISFAGDEK